jgi:hypothetical protein
MAQQGLVPSERKLLGRMAGNSYAAASFRLLRDATAAIDWFRNQGIEPECIIVNAQAPGEQPRPPQRGDNMRTDLTWFVALDLEATKLPATVVRNTLVREGGKLVNWNPKISPASQ